MPILCSLASANPPVDASPALGTKSTTHSLKVTHAFERYSSNRGLTNWVLYVILYLLHHIARQ